MVGASMKIDIWSDIACPWCYIGLTRFESALARFGQRDAVEVRLRSFQLDPELPESYEGTEAQYLAERKGMDVRTVGQMFAGVAAVGAKAGLDLRFDDVAVANSRAAHRVLHEAQHADPSGRTAWELKKLLFAAHFSQGERISDPEVLVRLAAQAGLDAEAARAAAASPVRDAEVREDRITAMRSGVQGVPFFLFAGRYGLAGAQSEEAFLEAMDAAWQKTHPQLAVEALTVAAAGPACGVDGCD